MKVAKTTSKAWSLALVVAAYGIAIVELVADVQLLDSFGIGAPVR